MKRSLIFCAIALVAVAVNTASAAVDVQLNLRYDNPADESAGGTWDLLVKSTGTGVAGVSVLIDGVTGAAAAGATGFNVFETQSLGTVAEIVAGFDLVAPATNVGLGAGTPGAVADDLWAGNSPVWDNSALIASGAFGATRPSFVATSGTHAEGVNEFSGTTAVAAAFGTQSVRGDLLGTDTIKLGDANRDGGVNLLTDIFPSLGNIGGGCSTGSTCGWDDGDFNSDGAVNLLTDIFPALGGIGAPAGPPAISSVPEPTSMILFSLAGVLAACSRRRS